MKRIRIVSALLALAALAALVIATTVSKHGLRPVYAQSGCTDATLTGNYGFNLWGATSKNVIGTPLPLADAGLIAYDGAGGFSVTYTDMSPGKPTYIPLHATGSGTYTVGSDCRGSATCTTGDCAGITWDTVIVSGGTEVFGVTTTPYLIANFDFKKQ